MYTIYTRESHTVIKAKLLKVTEGYIIISDSIEILKMHESKYKRNCNQIVNDNVIYYDTLHLKSMIGSVLYSRFIDVSGSLIGMTTVSFWLRSSFLSVWNCHYDYQQQ